MRTGVIIGGGLTGLVAAERFEATHGPITILEAESEPGGACRSREIQGFTFDYTGHLLHVNRPETSAYFEELGIWDQLEVHERRAAIDVAGSITPYPIQINTHGLAPQVRRDCLLGFIRAWSQKTEDQPADFREWVLERFGEGFATHFFFPYNSKLYRAEPEELTLDWVGRYVPKPKIEDVVDGAFGLYRAPVGYNATFRYPRTGGIRLLADAIAARIGTLRLNSRVTALHLDERWVELTDGERLPYDAVVFTASLDRLADLAVGGRSADIRAATARLRAVQVANIALGVEGPAPREEHWLYFPDRDVPYYRVGIPSNHGTVAPAGHHTLSVEISLDSGAPIDDEILAQAESSLTQRGLLDPERVKTRQILSIDPAYVVFDHRRREAVAELRRLLRESNIILAGRWAEWKYSAMEDAVLDGMRVARTLPKILADS